MARVKITVSLPPETAEYLRSKPNASAVVAQSVAEYRARELERNLEEAYREGRDEAERLDREWRAVDAEVEE